MDLNLYLGLPYSSIRPESDLGLDLVLASIPLSAEDARSTEMSGFTQSPESHAPYSPTHASYTPSLPTVDRSDHTEEPQIPHSNNAHTPPFLPYRLVHPSSAQNNLESNSSSHLECSLYELPHTLPSQTINRTGAEPLGPEDVNDPAGYAPYSPSYSPMTLYGEDISEHVLDRSNSHVEHMPYSPSYAQMSPRPPSSSQDVEGFALEDGDFHIPYSPSYVPMSPAPQAPEDHSNGGSPLPAVSVRLREATVQTGEPLSQDDPSRHVLQYPEIRLQRLIESSHRWPIRRFRSTGPHIAEPAFGTSSLTMEDDLLQDIVTIERSVETSMSNKARYESLAATDFEEKQGTCAANFECNICLDMAKEPVVTSCGHLFCWPCLYQWLHLYCDHKECPACKGKVTESNITPIYGRGGTEAQAGKKAGEDGGLSLKVPPRPHGCRLESLRQRNPRLLSRRLGEQFSLWRRILDEEIQNGHRVEGQESSQPGIFDGSSHRVLTRLMAGHQFPREGSSENGLNSGANRSPRNTAESPLRFRNGNSRISGTRGGQRTSSSLRDRIDFWHRVAFHSLPSSDGVAALTARFSSSLESPTNNANNSGASAPVSPQNPESLHGQVTQGATSVADQASASSTMAMIQGEAGALDASAKPSGAESSRSMRRRRRNATSSSLDVDGGVHRACKRRRLN